MRERAVTAAAEVIETVCPLSRRYPPKSRSTNNSATRSVCGSYVGQINKMTQMRPSANDTFRKVLIRIKPGYPEENVC